MQLVHPERVIKVDELLLEPILPAHASKLFEALQSPELYMFIPLDPPKAEKDLEERYSRWSKRQSPEHDELWLNYAVYHRKISAYVGTVQATLEESGKTLIAYEVFPEFWRRGIGTSACSALLDHLFNDYGISTVSALMDTRNIASRKLLESLGFRCTGTIPNADEFKGAISDEFSFELTRNGWADRSRRLSQTPGVTEDQHRRGH
ncbi:MAG TPA: GNAT family protein [Candidatus Baltobacteraceae bacterium]|jgi:RimJ/RimL family protein N-acetyltransferase|nr:GNAT family protein [Candidatus Baltobacteraceae bacterium]